MLAGNRLKIGVSASSQIPKYNFRIFPHVTVSISGVLPNLYNSHVCTSYVTPNVHIRWKTLEFYFHSFLQHSKEILKKQFE